ncbi:MAG: DNA polymerase III subunit beta [Ruminococcus sp.]|jgi:DNA polymerase-3 subunit beta|nr:DNA polymerase III subunit beta [Ruminococcus sp.]
MVFSVEQEILNEALSNVSKAVAERSAIAALEGIKFEFSAGKLTLTGYDLEIGIKTAVDAVGSGAETFVLNARLICEMVRKLPHGTVNIEISGDENAPVRFTCGAIKFSLTSISAEDYPDIPEYEKTEGFEIAAPTLRNMITMTKFAVAQNDIKPILTGEKFETGGGVFEIVGMDGYRLAIRREEIDSKNKYKFVIKAKALTEVASLINEKSEENIKIYVSSKNAAFETGSYIIYTRLLEGEYFDYGNAVPTKDRITAEVKIAASGLIKSLERSLLLIDERIKSPVRLVFKDNVCELSCRTARGEISDELECEVSSGETEIGFNAQYLLSALRSAESDEVLLKLVNGVSPMLITPIEGDSFMFIVLPIRLH